MIVIADDITGAAEMAGIAFEKGMDVGLLTEVAAGFDTTAGQTATVIATDTRSMTEAEAAAETRRIANIILETHPSTPIFKKTDSALRGHVVAELRELMQATGLHRAVYMPANPSKGRVIRHGTYYINKVRLHETDFSFDPEFPATTSVLRERFPDAEAAGIIMPDAETQEDIEHMAARYNDGKTLFAGAADLFEILCSKECGRRKVEQPQPMVKDGGRLLVCGSTQSRPPRLGIAIAPMPLAIYDGADDLSLWNTEAYSSDHSLILTIPHTHRTGKEAATHLRSVMAAMVKQLVGERQPAQLIIEGGATAWATLRALGWKHFRITQQPAPGVVSMQADNGTIVTLKPGSYPWGATFAPERKL